MKTKTLIPVEGPKKENRISAWLSIGILFVVVISIAGLVLLKRYTVPRNEHAAVIPSPTIAPVQTSIAETKPAQNYTPMFETIPCSFEAPNAAHVSCGFVIVPEDRSGEVTDTVKIAIAVFHSANDAPKSDPILYLQGGPGGKAIEWAVEAYKSVIAPLTADRDFIVFDPRGVGLSQPALECEEFKTTYLQDLEGKIPIAEKASYYQGALLSCKNKFLAAGANLATYTSADMAADARDVLVALGYQQADVYGVSYGTRIAQFLMREYPEFVRSAILDSVVPVEVQLLNQDSGERNPALQTLFDDCKSQPDCSSAYPDLESVYHEVLDQLDAQPIKLEVSLDENRTIQEVVDGSTFRDTVLWSLRAPQTIELAPQLIYHTREGDDLNLVYSLALPILAFDSISMGNYISVNCHDQVFAMSTMRLDNTVYEMCQLWGSDPPAPDENDPVNSDIPTLIFAGKYDPVTPPSFAHQLNQHLKHSFIVEFPNQGHAPSTTETSDCPIQAILSFLQDPTAAPNASCIEETQSIEFIVPYHANDALTFEPVRLDEYGVNTRIPSAWSAASFGFYNRNNSLVDITQIGIQRAPVSESQWLTWLSANFGSNRGFDQPAAKHDQHKSNGLTWSIYQTRFQGNPVEIAFANSGKQTIMVLLISHKDEHDALYNGVFLRIIDATTPSK
jgi:pimeloyl-ACP methyl ester carboxylesterase